MKLLIKTALLLAVVFASTFIILKLTGILTIKDIEVAFQQLQSQPAYMIGGAVILLLFADLFIAVPTMTVIILAGVFLGFQMAALFSFIGLFSAGITGYLLSRLWGEKLLNRINKDEEQRQQMSRLFNQHGILMLILSRAMPILPEVSACLAGMSKMPFNKFLLGWTLSSIPYLLIVSYSGSISDLENPKPALFTALAVTSVLWLTWMWFLKFKIKKQPVKLPVE